MLEAKRENVHVHALDMDLKCRPARSIYDLRDNGKTYIFVGYELSQKDEGGSFWVQLVWREFQKSVYTSAFFSAGYEVRDLHQDNVG